MGWWGQTVRETLSPRAPDPPASQPTSVPVGASPEDRDAEVIIRRAVEVWPTYEPGADA